MSLQKGEFAKELASLHRDMVTISDQTAGVFSAALQSQYDGESLSSGELTSYRRAHRKIEALLRRHQEFLVGLKLDTLSLKICKQIDSMRLLSKLLIFKMNIIECWLDPDDDDDGRDSGDLTPFRPSPHHAFTISAV